LEVGGGEATDLHWSRDGIPLIESDRISGTTTNALLFTSVDASDEGRYELTASNQCGTATSERLDVTVAVDPCFPTCRCDANQDGSIDGSDVMCFLEIWEMGLPCSDWNQDGAVDSSDFFDYLQSWEMCCC
ncbi:MAG: hypothetical protein NTV94_11305, partial [Planctomycetota bacterium]|nr:hypothetical protein [Planctomycetota bacterium]